MGACTCGYTTDPEKNCNGTHNVVKAVKADIIAKLEANGHADAAESLKAKQKLGNKTSKSCGLLVTWKHAR